MTQRSIGLDGKCNAIFESYLQATSDAIVTNDQKPRTYECIAFGPSGNQQSSLKCFDLKTGKVVILIIATVTPMLDRGMKKLNAWGLIPKRMLW